MVKYLMVNKNEFSPPFQTMDSSYDNGRTPSESEHSPLINSRRTPTPVFDRHSRRTSTPVFDRPTSIFTRAVICILFTELCERLTFYGISGNLQLFASDKNQLNLSPQMASTISYIFSGASSGSFFYIKIWCIFLGHRQIMHAYLCILLTVSYFLSHQMTGCTYI